VRHEQAAAFAADGYARVTGKPGVCLGTSGPGATNLITGLTSAMMDSIPIVALTGQVPAPLIGKDGFQEADTIGISLPSTKQSFAVRRRRTSPASSIGLSEPRSPDVRGRYWWISPRTC
jgi:acetolactate synthase-1/2/3 large subunit